MFVNNGTSQIQAVATGVQQLCNTLGSTAKSTDSLGTAGEAGVLLEDIRQLILANKERDQNAARLQASVTSLVAVINHQNANVFSEFLLSLVDLDFDCICKAPESVVELINRQRHNQEGLLKALATGLFSYRLASAVADRFLELSDEIRGERLKFVEAMKSATSINVQCK